MQSSLGRDIAVVGAAAVTAYALYTYLSGGPSAADKAKARNQAETDNRNSKERAKIMIYYGSQTGTAESFATEIKDDIERRGGTGVATAEMEDFTDEADLQDRSLVIFVLATYGEGDPTDNAMDFDKWLDNAKGKKIDLSGVEYAMMGLGNRQYVHFNEMAKKTDTRLEGLGATRIGEVGLADDDADAEADFHEWRDKLLPLLEAKGLTGDENEVVELTAEDIESSLPLVAEIGPEHTLPNDPTVKGQGVDLTSKGYFKCRAKVRNVRELRQDTSGGMSCVQVDFAVTADTKDYQTADTADILPENRPEVVEHFAKLLHMDLEHHVAFIKNPEDNKNNTAGRIFHDCSVKEALGLYCDLSAIPAKSVLRQFAAFCNDEDRENLGKILESPWVLKSCNSEVHLGFAEFWQLFMPSLQMKPGTFLQLCPRQKPRSFTISSSSLEDSNIVSATVGLIKKEMPEIGYFLEKLGADKISYNEKAHGSLPAMPTRKDFFGICSQFLCNDIKKEQSAIVYAHKSTFRLPPKSEKVPLIMIGAGTGVAPFRGFLRELKMEPRDVDVALIFGCQKRNTDYIYQDEFEQSQKDGILTHLITAFSREQKHKVYVQHKVAEEKELILELWNKGGMVYICGSTAMGTDVKTALESIVGDVEAHRGTRIIEELWG